MRLLSIILLLSVLLLSSCAQELDKKNRSISNAIPCVSSESCFGIGDALTFNSKFEWKPLSRSDSVISFHDYSPLGENATIFVLDHYYAEETKEYLIKLGSDDGFQVFVNGKKVASRIIGRSVQPDSDWIKVKLEKGINEIVFQVYQGTGGWGLYYKIVNSTVSKELVEEYIPEIYRDLPNAAIIQTEQNSLHLTIDPRSRLDQFHEVRIKWIDPFNDNVLWDSLTYANALPNRIKVPDTNRYPLLFDYEIIDGNKIIYKETIPIFNQEAVEEILGAIDDYELLNQWKEGIELLFAKELNLPIKKQYSTRLKAEFLWDILNQASILDYKISGPRTEVFNNHLAKRYIPAFQKNDYPKVLGLHVDFSDSVSNYLMSYPGGSHALMAEWNSYAQYYGVELFFPFIVEADPKLTTQETLLKYELQEPDSFNVIAWSKSTVTLFKALEERSFSIQKAGTISPWVLDTPTQSFLIVKNIAKDNSQIEWHWYRGEEDIDVPDSTVLDWIKEFERQGIQIHYSEIPYSSHWTYWVSPEKKLLKTSK